MVQIAQPLDEWCEFCNERMGVLKTADGVAACDRCAAEVVEAMKKQAVEELEAAGYFVLPNRAETRRAIRAAKTAGRRGKTKSNKRKRR